MDEAMQTARLGFTYFKGNAAPIPRQLSKYSEFCKDIAVFDWSGIVLFDLNSWDLITEHAGYGCFYTGQDNGGIFSLALLGLLIQALGQHLYGRLLLFGLVSSNCPNTLSRSFSCHSAFSSVCKRTLTATRNTSLEIHNAQPYLSLSLSLSLSLPPCHCLTCH